VVKPHAAAGECLQKLGCHFLSDPAGKVNRRRVALSPFTMEALAEHRKAMLAEGNYNADGPIFCDT
jgi:hypothetical protein